MDVYVRARLANQITFRKRGEEMTTIGVRSPGEGLAGGVLHAYLTTRKHGLEFARGADVPDGGDKAIRVAQNEVFRSLD